MSNYINIVGDCVAVLRTADGDIRLYGPFKNGQELREWADRQFEIRAGVGNFGVMPLRSPEHERLHPNDWWMDDMHQSREWLEAEFPNHRWDTVPVDPPLDEGVPSATQPEDNPS